MEVREGGRTGKTTGRHEKDQIQMKIEDILKKLNESLNHFDRQLNAIYESEWEHPKHDLGYQIGYALGSRNSYLHTVQMIEKYLKQYQTPEKAKKMRRIRFR